MHPQFARIGGVDVWLMETAFRHVWPTNPDRWQQQGDRWNGEIEIPPGREVEDSCLIAVRLPDGRLVRYDVEGLWRLPREWQPVPPETSDYQI